MIFKRIFKRILRASARPLSILLSIFSAGLLVQILSSFGSTKPIPIETIHEVFKTDTIYINNVQYDSIYISQDRYTDRSKDTILIRQHDIEYRYKLLRDTIEHIKIEVRHDSIPYEVRITEVNEVKHIPPWIKPISIIGLIALIIFTRNQVSKLLK